MENIEAQINQMFEEIQKFIENKGLKREDVIVEVSGNKQKSNISILTENGRKKDINQYASLFHSAKNTKRVVSALFRQIFIELEKNDKTEYQCFTIQLNVNTMEINCNATR